MTSGHPSPELMQDESSGKEGRRYNEWMAGRANSRQEAREAAQAIHPSTSAEKRLEAVLEALRGIVGDMLAFPRDPVSPREIEALITKYEKD